MIDALIRQPALLTRLLRVRTDSRPESLSDARKQIRNVLSRTRLSTDAVTEMDIAVGEILSNTHVHAYYSGLGPVFVEVFQLRWTVTVLVIDMGDAVAPPLVPLTLRHHTRRGGRGLYLASHLTDELEFSLNRTGHGLTVRLTKWFDDGLVQLARRRGNSAGRSMRTEASEVSSIWA